MSIAIKRRVRYAVQKIGLGASLDKLPFNIGFPYRLTTAWITDSTVKKILPTFYKHWVSDPLITNVNTRLEIELKADHRGRPLRQ